MVFCKSILLVSQWLKTQSAPAGCLQCKVQTLRWGSQRPSWLSPCAPLPVWLQGTSSTLSLPSLSRAPPNSLGSDAAFSREPAVLSATPRSSPWSSLQSLEHSSTRPGSSCLSACSHSALDSSPRWRTRGVPRLKLQPKPQSLVQKRHSGNLW